MSLLVRDASGLSEIGEVWVRDGAGLSQIAEIWVRDASGLSQVFGAFALTVSPTTAFGSTASKSGQRITTNAVTLTPKPGGAVTSISWTFDLAGWEPVNPGSLTTSFRSPTVGPNSGIPGIATCTVVRGSQTASLDVPLEAWNFGF